MLLKTKGLRECVSLSFVLGGTCHRAASQTQLGQRWTASRSACNSLVAASLLPKPLSVLRHDSVMAMAGGVQGRRDGRAPAENNRTFQQHCLTQHQVKSHAKILLNTLFRLQEKIGNKHAAVLPSIPILEIYKYQDVRDKRPQLFRGGTSR